MADTLPGNRRRVLIVENDEQTAQTFAGFLESLFEVESVRTILAAMSRIATKEAPAIEGTILDLNLENGKGIAVMNKFQETVPDIPVVIVTDYDYGQVMALQAGAQEYLRKPVSKDDLRDAVTRAIVRHQVRKQFSPIEKEIAIAQKVIAVTDRARGLTSDLIEKKRDSDPTKKPSNDGRI